MSRVAFGQRTPPATAAGRLPLRERAHAQAAPVPVLRGADFSRVPASAMPYRDAIQKSFGRHDLSGVRAHTAPATAGTIGAKAFTIGQHIAFADRPTLFTAAHEAAHAVQQRSGLALPGGIGALGDRHERHADEVAKRVVAGESSEDLLDAYAARAASPRQSLQMSPQSTYYGKFIDTTYKKLDDDQGVEILLEFEPGDKVDSTKIGLVQSIKAAADGKPIITDPSQESRIVGSGAGEGYRIDRITGRNNPIYGSDSLKSGKGLKSTPTSNAPKGKKVSTATATYELGYRYTDKKKIKTKNAWLHDSPERPPMNNSSNVFETTALALDGTQKGTYYGSVQWGWERDAAGKLSAVAFAAVSQGTPSQNFLAPAAAFNTATTRGTLVVRANGTQVYKISGASFAADFTVDKDTKVTSSGSVGEGGVTYAEVTIVDGTSKGKNGFIKVTDIQDKGDGKATADLPVPEVHLIDAAADVTLNDGVPSLTAGAALPKGTRVTPTGATMKAGEKVFKWIAVVDGPNTGASGYVPETVLKKERP